MRYDVAIIGAGADGLAAASLLARAGRKVVVLERAAHAGGRCVTSEFAPGFHASPYADTVAAPPPMLLPLLGLPEGLIEDFAPVGADIVQRRTRALARVLAEAVKLPPHGLVERLKAALPQLHRPWPGSDWADRSITELRAHSGQNDWRAALAGGFAPSEPGSALALIWRASLEMAGQSGALALAVPGTLMAALRRASNAEVQTDWMVAEILVTCGRAVGVRLQDGDMVGARAVLSSRTRSASEALAGLDRPQTFSEAGDARIVFTLGDGVALPPAVAAGRCFAALPTADCADAYEAARAGRLPPLVPFSVTAETPRSLVVDLPLMPVSPPQGWGALKAPLAATLVKTLSRHVSGLARVLTGVTVTSPRLRPRASLAQLLAPAFERAVTRVPGLYLCGEDAEPVPCVSGRAGRFAAHFALKSR